MSEKIDLVKIDLVRTTKKGTEHKDGYIGPCRLALALGCIAPMLRKDWWHTVIIFFSPIAFFFVFLLFSDRVAAILRLLGIDMYGFIEGFMSDDTLFSIIFILSFFICRVNFYEDYNKMYTKRLLKKGFKPADKNAEQILKEAGIGLNDDEADPKDDSKPSQPPSQKNSAQALTDKKTTGSLLKDGFALLDQSKFEQAGKLFEQVLDIDTDISSAYLGVLMAEQKCRNLSELAGSSIALEDDELFQKALELANQKNRQIFEKCIKLNRAKRQSGKRQS